MACAKAAYPSSKWRIAGTCSPIWETPGNGWLGGWAAGRLHWGTLLREPPTVSEVAPLPLPEIASLPLSPRQHERQQAIFALRQRGLSQRWIATHLPVAPGTVRRYLHGYTGQRPRPSRSSLLDPFRPLIFERWQAGWDAMQIYQDLRQHGYRGKHSMVRRLVTTWRQEQTPSPPVSVFSARHLRWLLVRASDQLTAAEQAQRLTVLATIPDACTAFNLYHRFWGMLHQQQPLLLADWLRDAEASGLAELRTFATGVQRDSSAVVNGITSPLSQGQTEGQVTKLKLIKRIVS
jgi:transposase